MGHKVRLLEAVAQTGAASSTPLKFARDTGVIHWELTLNSGSGTITLVIESRNGPGDAWTLLSSDITDQTTSANISFALQGLACGENRVTLTAGGDANITSNVYIVVGNE